MSAATLAEIQVRQGINNGVFSRPSVASGGVNSGSVNPGQGIHWHNVPTIIPEQVEGQPGIVIQLHNAADRGNSPALRIPIHFDAQLHARISEHVSSSGRKVPIITRDDWRRTNFLSPETLVSIDGRHYSVWRDSANGNLCVCDEQLRLSIINGLESQYTVSGIDPRFHYFWNGQRFGGIFQLSVYGHPAVYTFQQAKRGSDFTVDGPNRYSVREHGHIPGPIIL